MEMPPVSKRTPLPTKHSVLARLDLAPCHCITTMREGRSLPCPTASSAPIFRARMLLLVEHLDLEAGTGKIAHALGELDGAQHVGRLVDEVARQEHALGQRLAGAKGLGGGVRLGAVDGERAQALRRRLLLRTFLGLLGPVFLEGVAAQQRAQRQVGGEHLGAHLAGVGRVGHDGAGLALARAELGEGKAAELQAIELLGCPAGAEQDQPRGVDAGGRQHLDRRLGLAGEVGGAGGLGQCALGALVDAARRGPERQLLAGEQQDGACRRGGQRARTEYRGCRASVGSGSKVVGLRLRWRRGLVRGVRKERVTIDGRHCRAQ